MKKAASGFHRRLNGDGYRPATYLRNELAMAWTLGASGLTASDLSVLLLGLGLLLGLARVLGEVAQRFGQPAVLGEILAGVLLGPTILGRLAPGFAESVFPVDGGAFLALSGFTTVAVTLLLLIAGIELDLSIVWRQGRAALLVSLSGLLLPAAIGIGLGFALPAMLGKTDSADTLPFAMFLGIAMSITALPIIAKVLMDLNIFRSDLGMLIMSAAMVDDLVGWMAFAVVLALMVGGPHDAPTVGLVGTLVGTLLFAGLGLTVMRSLIHRCLPWIQARTTWPGGVLSLILTLALLCAALTEWLGIHAIFGAFIAGIAIGDSTHLRERTKATVHDFVSSIFAPIFFATIGLRIDFFSAFDPLVTAIILGVALLVKIAGCAMGAKLAGLTGRESLAIGFGMSSRGAMEIVLAQLARGAGLITDRLFVSIVLMALITSLIAGPLMQKVLRRPKPRRLMNLLSESGYLPQLASRTPEAAIVELTRTLSDRLPLPVEQIARDAIERERLIGTGLPNGVAVPHCRADIREPLVAVGRSDAGIDFDAADGSHARLIVLLVTPQHDGTAHVELLSDLAHTLQDPEAGSALMHARTYFETLAALNTVDRSAPHASESRVPPPAPVAPVG